MSTLLHDTNWVPGNIGSTSSGGAGSTTGAGDGWIDEAGGVAVAGSNNQLFITCGGSPFGNKQYVLRPASETTGVLSQKLVAYFDTGDRYLLLRVDAANNNCYILGTSGGSLYVFRNNGGSLTQLGSATPYTALTSGDVGRIEVSATGANPTTLTITVFDDTTSTQLGTLSVTDSAGPQTAGGQMGITCYSTTSGVRRIQTYSLDTPTTITVPINSPAFSFDPFAFVGDAGRTGTQWMQTCYGGCECEFAWSTTSSNPTAVINGTAGGAVKVYVSKNGGAEVSGTSLTLTPLLSGAGSYVARIVYDIPQTTGGSWAIDAARTMRITGATLDSGATAGTAWVAEEFGIIEGDSITLAANSASAATAGYAYLLKRYLRSQYNIRCAVMGIMYRGYQQTGNQWDTGDVPRYYHVTGSTSETNGAYDDASSSWNKVCENHSMLDSASKTSAYGGTNQQPRIRVTNLGTNCYLSAQNGSSGVSGTDVKASVYQSLHAKRQAEPNTIEIILMNFGLYYETEITAAVDDYKAAYSDNNAILIDLGSQGQAFTQGQYSAGAPHPNDAGHLGEYNLLTPHFDAILNPDTTPPTVTGATLAANGTDLTVVTSEATTGTDGFTVKVGGTIRSATATRTDTTHILLTLASAAYSTDTVTLSYAPGSVEDLADNALGAFNNSAVTNNSTQSAPLPTVATPTFNPPAGTYNGTQSVSLSSTTGGAAFYYTTDGTTPTTGSTLYTGPISVSASETLKVLATHANMANSAVASAIYTIQSGGGTNPRIDALTDEDLAEIAAAIWTAQTRTLTA